MFQFSQTYTNLYLTYFSCYIYGFNVLFHQQSLFSVSQVFMQPQPPLCLIHKACFLFLSFLCDDSLHFSLSTKPIFSVSQFLNAITASSFPCQAKPVFCFLVF